ncbi:PREDICTED: uncharacterized protein LOC106811379 [Priapulus caudatus]|uniref:Uncharacterized protein LOC106811379 n=1 Tax=Priapulus caudatus TaxID=37621 RepID=A0ABM1EE30_PRICU|nr:PREDICTED: uncharacterized protein LOC106811379 [Priapulus caudatus]
MSEGYVPHLSSPPTRDRSSSQTTLLDSELSLTSSSGGNDDGSSSTTMREFIHRFKHGSPQPKTMRKKLPTLWWMADHKGEEFTHDEHKAWSPASADDAVTKMLNERTEQLLQEGSKVLLNMSTLQSCESQTDVEPVFGGGRGREGGVGGGREGVARTPDEIEQLRHKLYGSERNRVNVEDDILYQWRLRRKMGEARQIAEQEFEKMKTQAGGQENVVVSTHTVVPTPTALTLQENVNPHIRYTSVPAPDANRGSVSMCQDSGTTQPHSGERNTLPRRDASPGTMNRGTCACCNSLEDVDEKSSSCCRRRTACCRGRILHCCRRGDVSSVPEQRSTDRGTSHNAGGENLRPPDPDRSVSPDNISPDAHRTQGCVDSSETLQACVRLLLQSVSKRSYEGEGMQDVRLAHNRAESAEATTDTSPLVSRTDNETALSVPPTPATALKRRVVSKVNETVSQVVSDRLFEDDLVSTDPSPRKSEVTSAADSWTSLVDDDEEEFKSDELLDALLKLRDQYNAKLREIDQLLSLPSSD